MLIKLEWLGYRTLKKVWQYVKPFSLIPERYGQTADWHMDRIAISISRVSVLKRDKKSHDSLVGYGQEYGPLPVFKFSLRGNLLGEISAGCYISCRPIRLLRRDKVDNVACRPISNAKTAVHDTKATFTHSRYELRRATDRRTVVLRSRPRISAKLSVVFRRHPW